MRSNILRIITSFVLIGFFAWFLIHFLSIFGIFLFLAYPVWWFLFPERKMCFLCRIRGRKHQCSNCGSDEKNGDGMGVKTMSINMLLIFFFTAISIGGVFLEYTIISRYFYKPNPTAHFNISSQRTVYEGQIFPIELLLDGIEKPINAVQIDLSFDPEKLEVVEFVTKDSFIKIFIDKQIDNSVGFVRVSGGVPNPGYNKKIGLFGNLLVRAKKSGLVTVSILPSSAVLLNDGLGTNIMKQYGKYSYLILPKDDAIPADEEGFETALILGAQADQDKERLNFFEEDGTIYPVENSDKPEIAFVKNNKIISLLHALDGWIMRIITLSF